MTATTPVRRRWAVPYRPLRARSLLLQLVVLAAAEVLLFASYAGHDARFHWATHFLVGLIAAAVFLSAYLVIAARPAPGQLILVLVLHLVAMAPDLLFRAGTPHYLWMDLFLGHVSAHYLPGGDDTWLVLALLALAGYTWLLTRWVAARHAEAAAGLPPGIGIGGLAVLRPQHDPRTTPLAHHTTAANPPDGEHVVLLPDLAATGALWRPVAQALAERGTSVTTVDLLGHGGSIRIGTRFTLADQVDALARLLDGEAMAPTVLVGHGWGAAVAAELAHREPNTVRRLVLLDPPVHAADPAVAPSGPVSWMVPRRQTNTGLSNFTCGIMCLARGPLSRLPAWRGDDGDRDIVRARVQHTYPPLRDGVDSMLTANPIPNLLRNPTQPITLMVSADAARTAAELGELSDPAVRVDTLPADLRLPPGCGDQLAELIIERST